MMLSLRGVGSCIVNQLNITFC